MAGLTSPPAFATAALLAIILAKSGFAKLLSLSRFGEILQTTYHLNVEISRIVGLTIPIVEVSIASAALVPATRMLAFVAALAFVAVVGIEVSVAIARGRSGECGCFGGNGDELGLPTLFRLLGVATIALVGLLSGLAPSSEHPGMADNAEVAFLSLGAIVTASLIRELVKVKLSSGE